MKSKTGGPISRLTFSSTPRTELFERITMAMRNHAIIFVSLFTCLYFSVASDVRNKGIVIGQNDTIECSIPDNLRTIGYNRIVWRIQQPQSGYRDVVVRDCISILDSKFCHEETNSGLGSILRITNFALPGSTYFDCSSDNPNIYPTLGPDTVLQFLVTGICKAEININDEWITEYNSSENLQYNASFSEGDDVTITCLYDNAAFQSNCPNIRSYAGRGQVVFTAELAHDGCKVECVGISTLCKIKWILEVTRAATTVPAHLSTNLATNPPREEEQDQDGTSPSTNDPASPMLIIVLFISFILLLILTVGLALYLFLPGCRTRRQRNDSHKQSLDNLQQPTYSVVAETMNQREGNGHGHDGIAGDARGETSGVEYDVCERQSVGRDADGSGSRNEVEYEYTDVVKNEVMRSDKKHVTETSQKNDGIEDGATANYDYSYVGEGNRSTATPVSTSNKKGTTDDDSIPEYATVVKSRDNNPSTEKSTEPPNTQPAESDSDIPEYAVVNKKK